MSDPVSKTRFSLWYLAGAFNPLLWFSNTYRQGWIESINDPEARERLRDKYDDSPALMNMLPAIFLGVLVLSVVITVWRIKRRR